MLAVMFVALNVADAYLTKVSLSAGAVEFNPLLTYIGSSLMIKGLLAAAVVFVLYGFGRERVLVPLNFLLCGLILWNAAVYCILAFGSVNYLAIGI
jgi:hypothetical protein